ncbi:MAG TPA: hypothetical protein VGF42_04115 [Caulobacteraceae bacterium]|jgi:hypothetical protein
MHRILNLIDRRERRAPGAECQSEAVSRRRVLKGGALLAGGALAADAGLPITAAWADTAKVPKSAVSYLGSPRGDNRCELCVQFQPPSSCKLVDGSVSPLGSCTLFKHK